MIPAEAVVAGWTLVASPSSRSWYSLRADGASRSHACALAVAMGSGPRRVRVASLQRPAGDDYCS
jgi:hypothetical protein